MGVLPARALEIRDDPPPARLEESSPSLVPLGPGLLRPLGFPNAEMESYQARAKETADAQETAVRELDGVRAESDSLCDPQRLGEGLGAALWESKVRPRRFKKLELPGAAPIRPLRDYNSFASAQPLEPRMRRQSVRSLAQPLPTRPFTPRPSGIDTYTNSSDYEGPLVASHSLYASALALQPGGGPSIATADATEDRAAALGPLGPQLLPRRVETHIDPAPCPLLLSHLISTCAERMQPRIGPLSAPPSVLTIDALLLELALPDPHALTARCWADLEDKRRGRLAEPAGPSADVENEADLTDPEGAVRRVRSREASGPGVESESESDLPSLATLAGIVRIREPALDPPHSTSRGLVPGTRRRFVYTRWAPSALEVPPLPEPPLSSLTDLVWGHGQSHGKHVEAAVSTLSRPASGACRAALSDAPLLCLARATLAPVTLEDLGRALMQADGDEHWEPIAAPALPPLDRVLRRVADASDALHPLAADVCRRLMQRGTSYPHLELYLGWSIVEPSTARTFWADLTDGLYPERVRGPDLGHDRARLPALSLLSMAARVRGGVPGVLRARADAQMDPRLGNVTRVRRVRVNVAGPRILQTSDQPQSAPGPELAVAAGSRREGQAHARAHPQLRALETKELLPAAPAPALADEGLHLWGPGPGTKPAEQNPGPGPVRRQAQPGPAGEAFGNQLPQPRSRSGAAEPTPSTRPAFSLPAERVVPLGPSLGSLAETLASELESLRARLGGCLPPTGPLSLALLTEAHRRTPPGDVRARGDLAALAAGYASHQWLKAYGVTVAQAALT